MPSIPVAMPSNPQQQPSHKTAYGSSKWNYPVVKAAFNHLNSIPFLIGFERTAPCQTNDCPKYKTCGFVSIILYREQAGAIDSHIRGKEFLVTTVLAGSSCGGTIGTRGLPTCRP